MYIYCHFRDCKLETYQVKKKYEQTDANFNGKNSHKHTARLRWGIYPQVVLKQKTILSDLFANRNIGVYVSGTALNDFEVKWSEDYSISIMS